MSSNEGFLSPRNLLINQKFCCDGPTFTELTNALWAAQDLPASESMLGYKTGLSLTGIQAVSFSGLLVKAYLVLALSLTSRSCTALSGLS
jgi:hypothetical protein